jgi:sulfur transfer protein SufE
VNLAERAGELAANLAPLPPEERLEALMEMGDRLGERTDWQESESTVFLRVTGEQDEVYVTAWSDAIMVRGLLAGLIAICDGAKEEEVRAFDYVAWLKEVGIGLSMTRLKGIASAQDHMRRALPTL